MLVLDSMFKRNIYFNKKKFNITCVKRKANMQILKFFIKHLVWLGPSFKFWPFVNLSLTPLSENVPVNPQMTKKKQPKKWRALEWLGITRLQKFCVEQEKLSSGWCEITRCYKKRLNEVTCGWGLNMTSSCLHVSLLGCERKKSWDVLSVFMS